MKAILCIAKAKKKIIHAHGQIHLLRGTVLLKQKNIAIDFLQKQRFLLWGKLHFFRILKHCVWGARYIHAGEIHKKKRPQNLILNSTALPILCYVHRFLNYHKNLILLTLYSMEGLVRDRYREM